MVLHHGLWTDSVGHQIGDPMSVSSEISDRTPNDWVWKAILALNMFFFKFNLSYFKGSVHRIFIQWIGLQVKVNGKPKIKHVQSYDMLALRNMANKSSGSPF